ncbi:hypothetical protein L5515_003724 [Caenorhabditis briggsae]|nr:hypothetical protein L5515_003724 [Caenorhabditis briggsae]
MMDKDIAFELTDNRITKNSIKAGFLLEDDAVISLSYEKNAHQICCQMNEAGTSFLLPDEWSSMQFSVESDKAPSRPATPADIEGPNPKKRKLDPYSEQLAVNGDLAASIGRYALYYNVKRDNYKRCAIPLTPRLAATFHHGENKSIKIGDEIVIHSWLDKNLKVATRAVKIMEEYDTIILQADGEHLSDKDFITSSGYPQKGMKYLLMGFSIIHEKTSHLLLSSGIIATEVTRRLRYTGSSGTFKGDSGGGCWSEDGHLIGMQIGVEKVPHTKDTNGRPASPASGGRCCIIAIRDILGHIQDLMPMPADSDADSWSE